MLVLSRATQERILIGDEIIITVIRIGGSVVKLGVDAPNSMPIVREELAGNGNKHKDTEASKSRNRTNR